MLAVLYPRDLQIVMLSSRVWFLFVANHLVPLVSQVRKNEVQGGIAVSRMSSVPATRTTSSEKLSRKLVKAFGRLEDGADSKTADSSDGNFSVRIILLVLCEEKK